MKLALFYFYSSLMAVLLKKSKIDRDSHNILSNNGVKVYFIITKIVLKIYLVVRVMGCVLYHVPQQDVSGKD